MNRYKTNVNLLSIFLLLLAIFCLIPLVPYASEKFTQDSDKELQDTGRYNLSKIEWYGKLNKMDKTLMQVKKGSSKWFSAHEDLISTGEKTLSLCEEYPAGCLNVPEEHQTIKEILAALYASRAYYHLVESGVPKNALSDLNRMMVLDNDLGKSLGATGPDILVFCRGFYYVAVELPDAAQYNLNLLQEQLGSDNDKVIKLDRILTALRKRLAKTNQ